MRTLKGVPASPGVAQGPAFLFEKPELDVPRFSGSDPRAEWARCEEAVAQVKVDLEEIREYAERAAGVSEAAIFEAQMMFVEDPALLDAIRHSIESDGLNTEAAVHDAIHYYADILADLPDATFSARAADLHDVGHRLVCMLLGIPNTQIQLTTPSIVIAHDLSPSDTVMMDRRLVLAFATSKGGPTSHTAILARSVGIPAIVAVGDGLTDILSGTAVLVDGDVGTLIVEPDEETSLALEVRRKSVYSRKAQAQSSASQPAISRDGKRVEMVANVGSASGARVALKQGAEGIGLLRTEFLYLRRDTAPNEDEQVAKYRAIFEVMGDRPVIVRTFDIGGDKPLPYIDVGEEDNPFLGLRGLRLAFEHPDLFLTQLRAILRAGANHNIKLMFPMVATLDEVRKARQYVEQARDELLKRNVPIAKDVEIGIMVEIPSTALTADKFASEVDFFSIGTNDLAQYTLAADRTNARVSHLADAFHPAVLHLIRYVIDSSHAEGKWTGLCGELACEPLAVPLLLGLGLDEFSMNPLALPVAKEIVRKLSFQEAQEIALAALELDDGDAVRAHVRESMADF